MHFGCLLVTKKKSNQFGKLFPAVITSYIDLYFLEGIKTPWLGCMFACKSTLNTLLIDFLLLRKSINKTSSIRLCFLQLPYK